MNILICYASTEGQTRKIAQFCASQLIAQGHSVEVIAAKDATRVALALFDAAILAGSVHMGRLQADLSDFAAEHAQSLNSLPTLFLQVSLAIEGGDAEEIAHLDEIAEDFCKATQWKPDAIHQIAGSFRFTEYDFFKSWAMRWIAASKGQDIDPSGDTEFTDWNSLAEILSGWP